MLSQLNIQNYALIDDLQLNLGAGLSTITGQTGAGKSIMLGALSLLSGGRADTKTVTDKERKTVVEAVFTTPEGSETIIRREISPSGRSRAFVDDSPVTLPLLEATTAALLDIHSQHANLRLNSREGQLSIIDAFAGNSEMVEDYRRTFKEFVGLRNRIRQLKEQNDRTREMRELLEYQLQQLDALDPKQGEYEQVERQYDMLSEADAIRSNLAEAVNALEGDGDNGALSQIAVAYEGLSNVRMELLDPDADNDNSLINRLRSAYIELKDISESLTSMVSGVEANPVLLAKTGARMNALYEATRRFKLTDPEELVKLRADLRDKLAGLDSADSDLSELEDAARKAASRLKEKGTALTAGRKEGALKFGEILEAKARPLGLENLHFEVQLQPAKLSADGADNIEFLCSFNKNGVLMPMARTASGGELSRLTLAIKSIMASRMDMPTVIFDEIDTGVSGEIADKMGRMMTDMASGAQVIAITHLPQVAAKGERHYKVFKEDNEERTISHIRLLTPEERVQEIASMISGERVTESAIAAARALLSDR